MFGSQKISNEASGTISYIQRERERKRERQGESEREREFKRIEDL